MVSNTKLYSNLCAIHHINNISLSLQLFLNPTGWAMSQSLPTDGSRWLNHDEIQEMFTKLKDVPDDGAKGYILEVDLEILLDKHDYFNQYVPAPEHLEVTEDMLSPLNKFCMEKLDLNHVKCTKLLPIYMISTNMSFTTELCNSTKNLVWC